MDNFYISDDDKTKMEVVNRIRHPEFRWFDSWESQVGWGANVWNWYLSWRTRIYLSCDHVTFSVN